MILAELDGQVGDRGVGGRLTVRKGDRITFWLRRMTQQADDFGGEYLRLSAMGKLISGQKNRASVDFYY